MGSGGGSGCQRRWKARRAGGRAAGRAYAFPLSLSFVSVAMSGEGPRLSLTATDETDRDLQVSSDLNTWTTLTTLKPAAQPVTFVDQAASGTGHRFYRARQVSGSP